MRTNVGTTFKGLALIFTIYALVSVWILEPLTNTQRLVVVPAIKKEFKIKVVSASKNNQKLRTPDLVEEAVIALHETEVSDLTPEIICKLKDNEWRSIENNTPCLKVSDDANRAKNGEAVSVRLTRSELNKTLGECFRSDGKLYFFPRPSVKSKVVFH